MKLSKLFFWKKKRHNAVSRSPRPSRAVKAVGHPARAVPELPQKVKAEVLEQARTYCHERRYVTGLRRMLEYLDAYPGNDFVLQMTALLVHDGMSLSSAYEAASKEEQLTDDLLSDTRLDSIFCECSLCHSTWVPGGQFFGAMAAQVTVINAQAGKCHRCGLVICRNCFKRVAMGVDVSLDHCPECGGSIDQITTPTGRNPRQAAGKGRPPDRVLLMTHGPVPPDEEYLKSFFRRISPDVLEMTSHGTITAVPVEDWRDLKGKAMALLVSRFRGSSFKNYDLETTEGAFEGSQFYMIRLFAKPDLLNEVSGLGGPRALPAKDAAGGILFWFDSGEISRGGHGMYGRFVYRNVLPHLAPRNSLEEGSRFYVVLDGDCLAQGTLSLPYRDKREQDCLKEVIRRGADSCYVVAVHGRGPMDFSKIDVSLSREGVLGYLGMTSLSLDFEKFYELTGEMALVPAFTIEGERLSKHDFQFLGKAELEKMGFRVVEAAL